MATLIRINGKDYELADIIQYVGQILTTTGDTISLFGQAMAIEEDRIDRIQEEKEKKEKEEQQQKMQEQLEEMQEQIKQLQKQLETNNKKRK